MIGNNITKSELLSYKGQNVITPWDRLKKHVFQSYPICKTEKNITNESELLKLAYDYRDESSMVWIVTESARVRNEFPWHYRPSDLGKTAIHYFPRVGGRSGRAVAWGDIKLVPTSGISYGGLKNKIHGTMHDADFDIFMISFHEAEADRNFAQLKVRFPEAQHVKNIEGIGNAHEKCGELANSEMVYIVDADADIMDHFKFDYIPPMSKRSNTTYVWSARNPINGLEYGYGAVKLFPKQQLIEMGHELPDFSAGASFYQPVSDISNITRFNKDPYRTWRSAFREAVKLASAVVPNQKQSETDERLNAWCTIDNGERFGRYCIKGALEGKAYGEENKGDIDALNKINDYEWLREQFVESMKKKIT